MIKKILTLFFVASSALIASELASENHAGKGEVNGIVYNDLKDFPTKWQIVTIRFRKDTGELRLAYANELAMKTLMSGSINYPDGAMFAKTNVATSLDEQYPNSIGPKEISRYQFMVKNKDKYNNTNGWGYALFDSNGKTFNEAPERMQNACYSCHLAVENRGDVFSRPFSFIEKIQMPSYKAPVGVFFKYVWMNKDKLPQKIQNELPKNVKRVRMLDNKKLMDNVFQGTLDELRPLLQDESAKSREVALFMASDKERFVMIVPDKDEKCTDFQAFRIVSTDLSFRVNNQLVCKYD